MLTTLGLGVLVALAASMSVVTAVFVRWAAGCRSALHASIVVFLFLMMAGMLASGLVYELRPSAESAVAGLWLASVIMAASVAIVFVAFLRAVRLAATGTPPAVYRSGGGFVVSVVGLVLANEFLMGWVFGAAAGSLPRLPGPGLTAAAGFVGSVVDSSWFLFTMSAEMLLTAVFLRDRLPGRSSSSFSPSRGSCCSRHRRSVTRPGSRSRSTSPAPR